MSIRRLCSEFTILILWSCAPWILPHVLWSARASWMISPIEFRFSVIVATSPVLIAETSSAYKSPNLSHDSIPPAPCNSSSSIVTLAFATAMSSDKFSNSGSVSASSIRPASAFGTYFEYRPCSKVGDAAPFSDFAPCVVQQSRPLTASRSHCRSWLYAHF